MLYIRNFHYDPVIEAALPMVKELIRYQLAVLKLLRELHPKHIFMENITKDISPEEIQAQKDAVNQVQEFFPKGQPLPENPTEDQQAALRLGAHIIYAMSEGDVFIHKTLMPQEKWVLDEGRKIPPDAIRPEVLKFWDPDQQAQVELHHKVIDSAHPQVKKFYEKREEIATWEMIDFLDSHPGEPVVIIYGIDHSFCDDFLREGRRVELKSVWWNPWVVSLINKVPKGCEEELGQPVE